MDLQLALSPETVPASIKQVLSSLFGVDVQAVDALSRRTLGQQFDEIIDVIQRRIVRDHPLANIVKGGLDDLREHVAAIDTLGKSRAMLVHARHVEEVAAVLQYLVSKPERYAEFSWRWENFRTAHGIRNRLLNLKVPIDPIMQEWIDKNLSSLKKVSSKFTGDVQKDRAPWEKYNNWLTPINLNEIFESTGRKSSYVSQMYDWNSQDVHFSPIGGEYLGYELDNQTAFDFIVETAERELHGLLRTLLPLMVKTDVVRDSHARLVLLGIYRLIVDRPAQFKALIEKRPRFAQLVAELIRTPSVKDRLLIVLLGTEPLDPLAIKVP